MRYQNFRRSGHNGCSKKVVRASDHVANLNPDAWRGPILDVGGGAGALCRELMRSHAALGRPVTATLFDLPEVIAAARRLYPHENDWQGIGVVDGFPLP